MGACKKQKPQNITFNLVQGPNNRAVMLPGVISGTQHTARGCTSAE